MPRAARPSTTSTSSAKPYSKAKPKSEHIKTKSRSGKDSHLYTDDNPSSTLHGTGFKDAATAKHTIELVSKRSLLYQFQTINTMYYRAAHHPSSKNNTNMQAAMKIFRHWLDETYPAEKKAQTEFPMLKKEVVEHFLPALRSNEDVVGSDALEWAERYVNLPKGKRLANVLMDESKPEERDLAIVRQKALEELVEVEFDGQIPGKDDGRLVEESFRGISYVHLRIVAYAFSPWKPQALSKTLKIG